MGKKNDMSIKSICKAKHEGCCDLNGLKSRGNFSGITSDWIVWKKYEALCCDYLCSLYEDAYNLPGLPPVIAVASTPTASLME